MTPHYRVLRRRLYRTKPSKTIFEETFLDREEAIARFFKEYGEAAAEVWPPERLVSDLDNGHGCDFMSGWCMVRLLYVR